MRIVCRCLAALLLLPLALPPRADAAQMMTRELMEKPAILLTAFGTSTKAAVVFDAFEAKVRETFPDHEVRWAFTSEVIRERVNRRNEAAGSPDRLKSPRQALADLHAEGFTKVAVEPLLIFPGEEREELDAELRSQPGLRIEVGETLLERWERVAAVLDLLAADFLPPEEGMNVIVAHGSPTTNVGSNLALLAVERRLHARWPNAVLGCVEGMFTREEAMEAAKRHPGQKVRFHPLMYTAGDHIMNDIMGTTDDGDGPSWFMEAEAAGKKGDAPTVETKAGLQYRGLGFLPGVNGMFIEEIRRALERL